MFFHYIGVSQLQGAAAYIAGAKNKAGIDAEALQVLVEYPCAAHQRKFAFHGHRLAADMLARQYGGAVSLQLYWLLYDEPGSCNQPFGYKPKIGGSDCIEPRVICEQITDMLKGLGRPALQSV